MVRFFSLLGTTAVLVAIAACGDDDPKTGNGVNDVHQSCELRAKWNRTGNDCSLCESAVLSAHCDCESLKDFSGACLDQENARKSACTDQNLETCLNACTGECGCVDKCYASASAACKQASDARDGCIAAACDPRCK